MLHVGPNPKVREVLRDLELGVRFLGVHGGPIKSRNSVLGKCYAVNRGGEGEFRSRTLCRWGGKGGGSWKCWAVFILRLLHRQGSCKPMT